MKKEKAWVLTASDLIEGDVIYLSGSNGWVRSLASALVFRDEELAKSTLAEHSADNSLVDLYLAEVSTSSEIATPVHFREEFRATGPSNYRHGKQENFNV